MAQGAVLFSAAEKQAMQQQNIQQIYLSIYIPLVPVVSSKFLDKRMMTDNWQQESEDDLPKAIAKEVERIAKACMVPLGITMN